MKRGQSNAYYDAAIARWWTKLRRAVNELDSLRAARERARKQTLPMPKEATHVV